MKEIKYTVLYCVFKNCYDSIILRSGSDTAKVISYGSYSSGSATLPAIINYCSVQTFIAEGTHYYFLRVPPL